MVLHRSLAAVAAAITILLVATPTAAQPSRTPGIVVQEPQPDIITLLKSRDSRQQAWGAWHVGAGRLRQLAPLVHDLVRAHLSGSEPFSASLDVALDTLIQLQSPLDAELLRDLHAVRPAQALIAASFVGDDGNGFLRHIVQTAGGLEWWAAANQLLSRNVRTVVPDFLQALRLKVKVYVVDDGRMVGGGGGFGMGVGCGAGGLAPGMPPLAAYTLTPFPHAGVVVLATGPQPIYYRRVVAAAGHVPASSVTTVSGPTGDDRLKYVAAAAALQPDNLPLRGLEQHSVVLRDGSTLETELARIRRDLGQRYHRLLAMLIERNFLPPDIQTMRVPEIDFEIEDHRRGSSKVGSTQASQPGIAASR
jgi:hypothetical protein